MVPSKSRKSSSRRSSILKPPKPRQPLQNVNLNSSSNENSPATLKLKRRVSFAEKKHVKEFCNSMEQGTVWDNTYEEHDISDNKSPVQINNDNEYELLEGATQVHDHHTNCNNISSEKQTNHVEDYNVQETIVQPCAYNEMNHEEEATSCELNFTNPVGSIESVNITHTYKLQNKVIEDQPLNSGIIQIQSLVPHSNELHLEELHPIKIDTFISKSSAITVYKDEDENLPDTVRSDITEFNMEPIKHAKLDNTCIQDIPMEFTCPIYNTGRNIEATVGAMYQDMSMEMTEAIPMSINSIITNLNSVERPIENDKTQHFQNMSLDLTVDIQSLKKQISNEIRNVPHKEPDDTQDMSMELTMAMPSILRADSNIIKQGKRRKYIDEEQTEIFQNVSMEITTAIPTVLNKEKVICNTQPTSSVSSMPTCEASSNTMVFHDISMELTKMVKPGISSMNQRYENHLDKIPNTLETNEGGSKNGKVSTCERTRLLDASMEITNAVNIRSIIENKEFNQINSNMKCGYTNDDKTRVYNDDPMEFTSAITHNKLCSNIIENNENVSDRTQIFHDNSMTMTAAIPSLNIRNKDREVPSMAMNKSLDKQELKNKTVMYSDVSMEVTEAVHSNRCNLTSINTTRPSTICSDFVNNSSNSTMMKQTDITPDNTIMHNEVSMEITAAVPTVTSLIKSHPMLDKENCPFISSLTSFKNNDHLNKPKINNAQSTVNISAGIPLHMQLGQHTCASSSNVNDAKNACLATLPKIVPHAATQSSNNYIPRDGSAILNQKECLKTYDEQHAVQDTNAEHSITHNISQKIYNAEKSKVRIMRSNTFNSKADDKENCAPSTLEYLDSPEYSEDKNAEGPIENNEYFNDSLELLECIEPPSFIGISGSIGEDASDNCNNSSKIAISGNAQSYAFNYQDYNLVRDEQVDESDDITCISKAFKIKQKALAADVDISRLDNEDEIQLTDIQKLQLTYLNNTNTQNLLLDCSAALCEITEPIHMIQNVNDQNSEEEVHVTCTNISNKHRDVFERSSSTVKNDAEESQLHDSKSEYFEDMLIVENIAKDDKIVTTEQQNFRDASDENIVSIQDEQCSDIALKHAIEIVTNSRQSLDTDVETGKTIDISIESRQTLEVDTELKEVLQMDTEAEQALNTNPGSKEVVVIDTDLEEPLETDAVLSKTLEPSIELDPFTSFAQKLKIHAQSNEIIWELYHENAERKMIVVGFISCSLLVIIYLTDDFHDPESTFIKEIKIISRLADDADTLISIVHRIILEKIDTEKLTYFNKYKEDVLPMLDDMSVEVKLAMDFMFDLRRLDDLNLMEINHDRVSFISRTKRMEIILNITVLIKPFDKIGPDDITINTVFGSIREDVVKKLITNVKRDHKFLRRYMSDVRDYIYLMEESSLMTKTY